MSQLRERIVLSRCMGQDVLAYLEDIFTGVLISVMAM